MMKRFLPTILLVVVCIVGLWYASSHNFFQKPKEKPTPLITVKKEDVTGIKITDSEPGQDGVPVIELQKKDGKWSMVQPAAYPLNTYSADSWAEAIGKTTGDKVIEKDATPEDLSKYGFDKPLQVFEATLADGTKQTLTIGSATPVSGTYYVKTDASSTIYQESEEQITPLKKKPFDIIEKSPFQFEYNKLNKLTVDWKGQSWTLTKSDPSKMGYESEWKLGALVLKADDGSSFLDKIINMATNQMIGPVSKVKMDNPELKVTMVLQDKDGKEYTQTYVGKIDGNDVHINQVGGPWDYIMSLSAVQELYDKAQAVRDKVAQAAAQQSQAAPPTAPPAAGTK